MSKIIKKLSPNLKEIRIHLCPSAPASDGARQFIKKYYEDIKVKNPTLPILVRECNGIEPKIWFRSQGGKESAVTLKNLSAEQVANLIDSNKD